MRDKKIEGGYINGIFFDIGTVRDIHQATIEGKSEYMERHVGRKRLPANVKRYIKTLDAKIQSAEKIINEYDQKERRK